MANKWLKTLKMDYDLKVGDITVYGNSVQEVVADDLTLLNANAIFLDLVSKGRIVINNSKPDNTAQCFVRPVGGDVTLNGMPVNNDGVPTITLGEAVKEIDAIESNKSVTIDASEYTEPVVVKPSTGKDAMKKVTVEITNLS